jgi:hypothetical protein
MDTKWTMGHFVVKRKNISPVFSQRPWEKGRSHTETCRHSFYKTRIGIIFLDIAALIIMKESGQKKKWNMNEE